MKRARKKDSISGLKHKNNITYNRDDTFENDLNSQIDDEKSKSVEETTSFEPTNEEILQSEVSQTSFDFSEEESLETADNFSDNQPEKIPELKNKARKKTVKKRAIIFTVSLLTVVLLFIVSLAFGGFFNVSNDDEISESYVIPADKATGKINVLLLGVDKDKLRTDTIIVASYDLDDANVKFLSIPRDTRMYIGKKYQKINAAHAISQSGKIKGPQGTIEAVTRLTGIPINYYIEFSFDAFKNVIDAFGGVYFDVPRDMYYKDPTQGLYIDLKKGYQHLDGDKAEQLVRFRQYIDGDIGRVAVQQDFIKAFAKQNLDISIITKIPDLYEVFKNDIETNFTLLDITRYMKNLEELSAENIQMFQLPGTFSGSEYKASYWIADMDKLKTLIETEFEYDASNITIHSEDGSSVSKDVKDNVKTTPKATSVPKSTSSSGTVKPTASPTSKVTETKKPTATKIPSETTKLAETKKPAENTSTSQKPLETPKVEKTAEPEKTSAPVSEETKRPARPTANVTDANDE